MPPRRKNAAAAEPVKIGKVKLDVREPVKSLSFSPGAGFSHVEDIIPIANEVVPVKFRGKPVNIDTGFSLHSWQLDPGSANSGTLTLQLENGLQKQVRAFQKTIPLMDPFRWMRNKERPSLPFFWFSQSSDTLAHTNQGYVDIVASAVVSKLGREHKLPHFCEFYGACRAVTDKFYYNLEDDIEDIRFTKWFWAGVEANEFGIRIVEKKSGRRLTLDEVKTLMKPDDEFLNDDESDDDESSDESSKDSESLDSSLDAEELGPMTDLTEKTPFVCDLEEAELETDEDEPVVVNRRGGTPKTVDSISTATSDASYTEDFTIHAELYGMPVGVMFLEHMDGTMDELLEDSSYAPVKETQQEVQWGAWLVQVCAALSQLQHHCVLTHNDLHTNNVLWKATDQQFLVYKDTLGRMWRVPTFGKVFTIIDYGRAIFLLNGYNYIGSDYDDGHDADGMYNFGPIMDDTLPLIRPNKSFDLCRLACSLLRGLFPTTPEFKPKAKLMTKENDWEVRETDHPLFNLVWSWLKADDGTNILETESGEEKYPGFELYSVIAATVHDAVPQDQFKKKMCDVFLLKGQMTVTEKPILLYL